MSEPSSTQEFLLLSRGQWDAERSPNEIQAAIDRGAAYLKKNHDKPPADADTAKFSLGVTALAGLSLLEAGIPAADPAIKAVLSTVRAQCLSQTHTYPITLALL